MINTQGAFTQILPLSLFQRIIHLSEFIQKLFDKIRTDANNDSDIASIEIVHNNIYETKERRKNAMNSEKIICKFLATKFADERKFEY